MTVLEKLLSFTVVLSVSYCTKPAVFGILLVAPCFTLALKASVPDVSGATAVILASRLFPSGLS